MAIEYDETEKGILKVISETTIYAYKTCKAIYDSCQDFNKTIKHLERATKQGMDPQILKFSEGGVVKSNIGTSEEGELTVDVVPTDISGKINLNSETVIPLSQIDIYLKPFYKKNEDFTKDIEKLKLFQQNTNIILTELSRKERRILEVELKVERLTDHIEGIYNNNK